MSSLNKFMKKRKEKRENKLIFKENLKNSGVTVAFGKAIYLGGHPELLERQNGELYVKNIGIFFKNRLDLKYLFIPVEKIVKAEFNTGEMVSKNEMISRFLAFGGYDFAFKKKTRKQHKYLNITYKINDVESSMLFECNDAGRIAGAVTQIVKDYMKANKAETDTTVIDLLKQLSILRAMNVLSEEEYLEKKKDLLSRM